ncbi:UDP-N-acetylglucosamine 2-epimerase (non-hydrolyzing) [Chitinophaga sedimenti]|uniref:non-hydrolyzing UDP-N-acetylglucosamine 2-epimerase n=1 Tax=Chitinophaga sedimenti TaxID=2033606 RepID=UPI0020053232|nr:UDP-N-acetylglucosamine 2-epimerase (non-hydrolyzing) [Chitinophaga sedimenti]MCK7558110.1 UDP-N-acetylglucosamine 2-epimerase (non-hydrolyzing) [Chitinophaga sedimenti]
MASDKKRILIVFGTRPEAIKMAPLVMAFKADARFEVKVCVTAQHRQMLDQVLAFFDLKPDYDLNLMQPNQTLYDLSSNILLGMKKVFAEYIPDYTFVHGDTTTSTMVALSAFYAKTKVCHVEAGLRTNDKYSPYPEELNRQLTSKIADYHFAPTDLSKANLLKEGIPADRIVVTGNTVIDALLIAKEKVEDIVDPEIEGLKKQIDFSSRIVLVTGHRRENFGEGFENICRAIAKIAEKANVSVVYPVHLNPNVQQPVNKLLSNIPNVKLISPLAYPAFVWLMKRAFLILTDSGGIQEEAPTLSKPVLVMRENTERPEALEGNSVFLVGTNVEKIVSVAERFLEAADQPLTIGRNPFGDGSAATSIVDFISSQN